MVPGGVPVIFQAVVPGLAFSALTQAAVVPSGPGAVGAIVVVVVGGTWWSLARAWDAGRALPWWVASQPPTVPPTPRSTATATAPATTPRHFVCCPGRAVASRGPYQPAGSSGEAERRGRAGGAGEEGGGPVRPRRWAGPGRRREGPMSGVRRGRGRSGVRHDASPAGGHRIEARQGVAPSGGGAPPGPSAARAALFADGPGADGGGPRCWVPRLLVAVHDRPAGDGERHRRVADLRRRQGEQVPVEHGEVGPPAGGHDP